MTNKMRSFVKGIMAGLVSKAKMPKGEPVAWLYNGVRLPKLPEWDKTAYPYAVIWHDTGVGSSVAPHYMLSFGKAPITHYTGFFGNEYFRNQVVGWMYAIINYPDTITNETEWGELLEMERTIEGSTDNITLIWANHDVVREDTSEVYLSASDPIPVYE